MSTITKSASVKVMLSYDYSHFEACLSLENDQGLTTVEIDEARKTCQRLASKAVEQYKKYKEVAAKNANSTFAKEAYQAEVMRLSRIPEHDLTLKQIAMLKEFQDGTWRQQFEHNYDFDDDENYTI